MKTTSRILVCLLGAIFIFSSLGVVLADDIEEEVEPLTPQESLYLYYIWLGLQEMGIFVDYNELNQYTQEVSELMMDWVTEFLADTPSMESWSKWIFPWAFATTSSGMLVGNDSFLEDLQDFAMWLVANFQLISDDVHFVSQPSFKIGEVTLYKAPIWWYAQSRYYTEKVETRLTPTVDENVYIFFASPNGANVYEGATFILTEQQSTLNVMETGVPAGQWHNVPVQTNLESSIRGYTIQNPRYYIAEYLGVRGTFEIIGYETRVSSFEEAARALSQPMTSTDVTISIVTEDIVYPDDDPDYEPGDSIVLGEDGITYVTINFPDTIEVSNLPAIVSTGEIPIPGDELNPGMIDAWRPISSLISVVSDSMAVVIGIIYEFPEEVIIPIYAVMGGLIIFGLIHAMKEH